MLGQLAPGLADAGAKVTVVTPQHDPRWPIAALHRGVQIVRLRCRARANEVEEFRPRWLRGWLRDHAAKLDAVLVSGLRQAAGVCIQATRTLGLPVALRAESAGLSGDCHWQIETRTAQRIKKLCRQADAMIAPFDLVQDELIAAGYPRERIHLCQAGVELPANEAPADRSDARAAIAAAHPVLPVPAEAPLVVSIAPLVEEANVEILLDGWTRVLEQLPEARLWLVGDGPLRQNLWERSGDMGLADSVLFPGCFAEMDELLQAADLLVWPGRDENLRQVHLQAMASARPLVMADTRIARQMIVSDESGLIVEDDSPQAWSAAVIRTLRDSARAQQLGAQARARAAQRFPFRQMIESHMKVLRAIARLDSSTDKPR